MSTVRRPGSHRCPACQSFEVYEGLAGEMTCPRCDARRRTSEVIPLLPLLPRLPRTMSLTEYQAWVKETTYYTGGVVYPAQTLSAESGELLGEIQRHARRSGEYTSANFTDMDPDLQAKIQDEGGDVLWGLVALCNEMNITLEQLAQLNRIKLEKRMAEGSLLDKRKRTA